MKRQASNEQIPSGANHARRETGLGVIAALFLLILIAFVLVIAFRVTPIYIEYYQIRKALASLSEDISSYSVSPDDLRRGLERRFAIDYISVIEARDIRIFRQQGAIYADLNYEDHRPLLGHLQIVGAFNERIQLYP